MKTTHELMLYAITMLAFYICLGIWSLILVIRSFCRPIDATPEKVAHFKKLTIRFSGVILAAVGTAAHAVVSKQYYLLGASALLFSLVLPILLPYIRLRLALRQMLPNSPAPNTVMKN